MKKAKITDSEIQRKFVEYVERMQDVGGTAQQSGCEGAGQPRSIS